MSKLQHVAEDLGRVYRKCRNIGCDEHEELLKILHELHTTMKTYHTYRAMEQQAHAKLAVVEGNLSKVEQGLPKEKIAKSRRYRLLSKERQKRWDKAEEARIKALKARNDYVLCVVAANAGVQKYFVDDLSDLIDAVDFGFHTSLSRSLLMYNSTLDSLQKSLKGSQDAMKKCLECLDSRADKQKFLESNNAAFMAPNKFSFQAHKGDVASSASNLNGAAGAANSVEKVTVQVEDAIFEDMDQRFKLLQKRLGDLKIENEEVWKTLETAEKTLMDMIESRDYDVSPHFDSESDLPQVSILNSAVPSSVGGHSLDFKSGSPLNGASLIPKPPETAAIKLRADKHETEDFYLEKFREYSMQCSVITRLQARFDSMEAALTRNNASGLERGRNTVSSAPPKRPRRKRIGRQAVTGQPKLFGGSLEEYAEATGQEVPLIVRSCIRVINLFGLHHQGVFRVSGSQVEINNFREAFERGEDPLADVSDSSDINSVAGVLKLYLRELREPLFPIFYFDQLMEISQLSSKKEAEFVSRAKDVVRNLPRPHFAVLRYLFAFLNHLSELSDENMMCPWNLAICFGPTLLPIPEDKNPVQVQPLVNELVKGLIVHQDEIFPTSVVESGAVIYEKYITPAEGVEGPPEELDSFDASPSDVSAHNISTLLTDEELLDESCASTRGDQVAAHRRSASADGASGSNSNNASDGDLVNDEAEISLNLFGKEDSLEAIAQYDFQARHERELSFRRGEVLRLTQQLSADWWRGSLRGRQGLVPDKYIMLNIRDDQREASASGGEDRASSAFSDSLASASVIKDNLNRQGQHRPAVDSQTSDPQVALSSQTANNVNPSSTNGIGAGWSEIGSTGRSGTVKSSIIPSNGLLITAIGSPTSMATTASTSVEAPWQARRRSLSPTEIVGNKVLDCSAPTLHMTSLKRKLPLRTSLSVDNAPQPEFVSPTSTILNTSAVSSASSSAEDSSPHHTGAISRLRRQSPLQFGRQQSPVNLPQRRAIHAESFESSAELARDLSEALHQAINSLASAENGGVATHTATDLSASNESAVGGSLLEEQHHKPRMQTNSFSQNSIVGLRSHESSTSGVRGIYPARVAVERFEPIAIAAAIVEPTVQVAAVRAIKNDAPDLVQDLPPTSASGGSSGGEEDDSPSPQPSSIDPTSTGVHGAPDVKDNPSANSNLLTMDSRSQNLSTAERFAMSNQCTIRKGSPRPTPRNYERSLSSGSSTPSTPSSSPQQGVLNAAPGDPFVIAQQSSSRRSSIGSVSPVLSLASTTTSSPSVQKLKKMFSEPDQRTPAPPLSPKPALKAKPVTLMKLGRRTNPIVAPRVSPPNTKMDNKAEKINIPQGQLAIEEEGLPTTSASGTLQSAPTSGPIREYKQTSC
ncbi:SLIT-ROBO Rho GTPase-activating protein 3-like isoform X2 [Varroa destructor]|uniref:SLIT-ROBO Rho GTPase-activating protein 1 n=3 Tax=Varroa TaxID=62624 RepID=A0A7M7JME7_VARDE|nr:SLIT-ROBO Rho GTPase-activating protein 3-like isoform X2 [Varroa destructor]